VKDAVFGDDVKLLSDSAVLSFGADSDTTLTHTDGTGIGLNGTNKITFNDASQFIQGASNAILALGATDEIDLTATEVEINVTTLDINGAIVADGAYTGGGLMTTGGNIVIPDDGNIGSATDTNAITISSGGVIAVTATTASSSSTTGALTVAGGAGVAADLFVGDDVGLISDGAILNFGADSDVNLTHVHNTGLLLNSTMQLQFNDSTQYISGTSGTVLSIAATDEIDLTATTIDINGAVALNGAITGATDITLSGELDAATLDISGAVDIDGAVDIAGTLTLSGGDMDASDQNIANIKTATFVDEHDDGNSSTSDAIDWREGMKHKSTLTGNCTYTFTAPAGPCNLMFRVVQDGTGSRTVTWPNTVKWPASTAPTLTTSANAIDIVAFYFDGTNYYGQSTLAFG